jgi:2-keto-3-deoxy-L-rhamnonate aldolase RhmA
LEDIISTPGIDGIFIGPGDLSLRLKFSEAGKPEAEKL